MKNEYTIPQDMFRRPRKEWHPDILLAFSRDKTEHGAMFVNPNLAEGGPMIWLNLSGMLVPVELGDKVEIQDERVVRLVEDPSA